MKLPNCNKPCKDCPFRKDTTKGWLGEDRIKEILNSNSFVCHKATDLQCAGFMIIKKEESTFVALSNKLKIDLNLKGQDLIFDTKKECIDHHKY